VETGVVGDAEQAHARIDVRKTIVDARTGEQQHRVQILEPLPNVLVPRRAVRVKPRAVVVPLQTSQEAERHREVERIGLHRRYVTVTGVIVTVTVTVVLRFPESLTRIVVCPAATGVTVNVFGCVPGATVTTFVFWLVAVKVPP
jgi:hypothetical protein